MFLKAFLVGGGICLVGQIIINFTHLTNGKLLVLFLIVGAILEGFGLYSPLIEFAGAGASVPISGFGCSKICSRRRYIRSVERRSCRMRNGHIGCDCCRVFCIRFVPSANKKEIIVTFAHCCEYNVTKGKVMSRYAVVNNGAKQIKKRKILRRLLSALVAVVIFAIIILAWVYWKSMTPTILDVAQTRIKSETTRAISEAVNIAMTDACAYSDFVTIEKNANDEISLIYADSVKVNALAKQNQLDCIF